MKATSLFILLTIVVLLWSCSSASDATKSDKKMITNHYTVTRFHGIEAKLVGDIHYTQSTDGKHSLQISGPKKIVQLIEVSVQNNTLILDMKKVRKLKRMKDIDIFISSPELHTLSLKGVGDIDIQHQLTTDHLDIFNKGVGDISIDQLNCGTLKVNNNGVGHIRLRGKSKRMTLYNEGVGDIKAKNLEAESGDVELKGVGDISCYATGRLNIIQKGVGSIQYKGNASIVKKGVGSVSKIDLD